MRPRGVPMKPLGGSFSGAAILSSTHFNFLNVNPRLCRGTHSVRHFREYSDLSDSKMERSVEDLAMQFGVKFKVFNMR